MSVVESSSAWSLFRWASVFYFSFCSLALVASLLPSRLAWLNWAWPYPFELAVQALIPVGYLSFVLAMLLGYAGVAPLAFYLQLRGPRITAAPARAVAGLVLSVGFTALLTIAAQVIARGRGLP